MVFVVIDVTEQTIGEAFGVTHFTKYTTIGAGDTFMGYFSYGLSQGMTPAQCLLLATKASSITVTRKGAADSIPTLEEIKERYPD